MKQTAMQELIEKLEVEINFINDKDSMEDKFYRQGLRFANRICNELLEKEKDQIENAYIQGFVHFEKTGVIDVDNYYNETFKK